MSPNVSSSIFGWACLKSDLCTAVADIALLATYIRREGREEASIREGEEGEGEEEEGGGEGEGGGCCGSEE